MLPNSGPAHATRWPFPRTVTYQLFIKSSLPIWMKGLTVTLRTALQVNNFISHSRLPQQLLVVDCRCLFLILIFLRSSTFSRCCCCCSLLPLTFFRINGFSQYMKFNLHTPSITRDRTDQTISFLQRDIIFLEIVLSFLAFFHDDFFIFIHSRGFTSRAF